MDETSFIGSVPHNLSRPLMNFLRRARTKVRHGNRLMDATVDHTWYQADGSMSVEIILSLIRTEFPLVRAEQLVALVRNSNKRRFQANRNIASKRITRIRCLFGHSFPTPLDQYLSYPVPRGAYPTVLYHCTLDRYAESIFEHGLVPGGANNIDGGRRHVYMQATVPGGESFEYVNGSESLFGQPRPPPWLTLEMATLGGRSGRS
jgi:hypothetical protein